VSAQQPAAVDVAVIGGGIIGLTVAWRAARRGLTVTLLERGRLGGAASRAAAGMLAPISEAEFGSSGRRLLELGLASAARWPTFAQELGEAAGANCLLRRHGALMLARDGDEAAALERELAFRQGLGLKVTRLRPTEARRLEPGLAPVVRLALEVADDHSVDPRAVIGALIEAAAQAGVTLRVGSEVATVEVDARGQRVIGVRLAGGERLMADRVVVAAGAWSGALAGLPADVGVPVRPVKGQILRLRDPAGPGLVERVMRFAGAYLVPRADGRYVLGATVEERGFDTTVTVGATLELLREAAVLIPGLAELELEELIAGLRPGTPDNVPLVGLGALDGLVWATGHYRNGILLAPLTGELIADLLSGAAGAGAEAGWDPQRFLGARGAPVGAAA